MIVDGWPGNVVVVYVGWSNIRWPHLRCMVEGEWSRTILGMPRLGEMMGLVGCSCNPPANYLPRIVVRVAIVSIVAHLRYLRVLIFVVLRLPDTLCIGGVGACGFRGNDHLLRGCRCEIPHPPRYHIRI